MNGCFEHSCCRLCTHSIPFYNTIQIARIYRYTSTASLAYYGHEGVKYIYVWCVCMLFMLYFLSAPPFSFIKEKMSIKRRIILSVCAAISSMVCTGSVAVAVAIIYFYFTNRLMYSRLNGNNMEVKKSAPFYSRYISTSEYMVCAGHAGVWVQRDIALTIVFLCFHWQIEFHVLRNRSWHSLTSILFDVSTNWKTNAICGDMGQMHVFCMSINMSLCMCDNRKVVTVVLHNSVLLSVHRN